jgi:hypothetical protein
MPVGSADPAYLHELAHALGMTAGDMQIILSKAWR